jgi:hypothetical protein
MENHPQKARKLFKYMTVIRNIAQHNPISKWMQYDQQFRLCVSRNPLRSWSSIDGELWLRFISTGNAGHCVDNNKTSRFLLRF